MLAGHRGIRGRRLPPLSGWSLPPRRNNPARSAYMTRHQQEFPDSRPIPVLPLTCGHHSAPGRSGTGHARHGGDKVEHNPVATSLASARPPQLAHSLRATSCRNVLCTPETTVSTRSSDVLDRRLPHYSGMSLSPRHRYPSQGVTITRHQQGFTVVHPMPSLPFACDSQTERESLGFPLSFTPGRAGPGRACQGRDRP